MIDNQLVDNDIRRHDVIPNGRDLILVTIPESSIAHLMVEVFNKEE